MTYRRYGRPASRTTTHYVKGGRVLNLRTMEQILADMHAREATEVYGDMLATA